MKKIVCYYLMSAGIILVSCSASKDENNTNPVPGQQTVSETPETTDPESCSWCGSSEAPDNLSWRTKIAPEDEPGEKIIISGTVYLPDGKTPAEDIIIYVYHTNAEGVYPKKGDETGNGKRHGYLRSWMKTNADGKYEFETIRPAPYRTHGGEPAHIHYTITGEDYPEYWITSVWFADDSRVTDEYLKSVKRSGGFSNVVTLTKDENDISRGERNIILEKYED